MLTFISLQSHVSGTLIVQKDSLPLNEHSKAIHPGVLFCWQQKTYSYSIFNIYVKSVRDHIV